MKRKLTFGLALLLMVSIFAGAASATTFISIATGGTGGTYYPLGGGLAEIITRHVPELQVTSETGNASVANINLLGTHQIEMVFAQNDIAYWGSKGTVMFREAYDNLRVVASLYPEHVHFVTLKGTGVSDIMDIKGKRVSVGAPGSGVLGDVTAILNVAGLKFADMQTDFLDFNATTQRFKDGQIDVGFVVAGYPASALMDLATTHDVELVPFSNTFMDKLIAEFPFFIKEVIPAGTYRGVDTDTPTPAVMAMLLCDADLPDDVVYKFTRAMWMNIDELHRVHAKAREITLHTALAGASVPVHPGAAKFYREAGIEVPEIK